MNHPTKYLALALCSITLAACGGGGGGGDPVAEVNVTPAEVFWPDVPSVSVASTALAKYEGEWQQACVNHMKLKTVLVATGATTFNVTIREDYYAYADCTGAVVATGSYGVPSEAVTYVEAPVNAPVMLLDNSTIQTDVNLATSIISNATFTLTGTGVKPVIYIAGEAVTPIQFADAYITYPARALTGGTTQGALLLYENELLTLDYVDNTPSFKVRLKFSR